MSGSGPTVFLLTEDQAEAQRAYEALEGVDVQRILTRTVL